MAVLAAETKKPYGVFRKASLLDLQAGMEERKQAQTCNGWGLFPKRYPDFLRRLPSIVELPDFYLCHADISSTGDPMETSEIVLLWGGRTSEVDLALTGGWRVVSGHDRTPLEEIRSSLTHNKILIDNGCFHGGEDGFGNLVALRLDDMELIVQRNVE